MNLLLWDDDPVARAIALHVLRSLDWQVTVAIDAAAAARALTGDAALDLAVLASVDDNELWARAGARGEAGMLRVALVSAGDHDDIALALRRGADDVVAKPLHAGMFAARARLWGRLAKAQQGEARHRLTSLRGQLAHDRDGLLRPDEFEQRLAGEWARAGRGGAALGLLQIAIVGLEALVEGFGDEVGQALTLEVAARLRCGLRRYDVLAEGDHGDVRVLLPDCDAVALRASALRLAALVDDRPIETPAGPIVVSLQLGAVVARPAAQSPCPGAALREALTQASAGSAASAGDGASVVIVEL